MSLEPDEQDEARGPSAATSRRRGAAGPVRVLAGGEDLATASPAVLERACQAWRPPRAWSCWEGGLEPGPPGARRGPAGRSAPAPATATSPPTPALRPAPDRRARRRRGRCRWWSRPGGGRPRPAPARRAAVRRRGPGRRGAAGHRRRPGRRPAALPAALVAQARAGRRRPLSSCATPTTCAPPSRPSAGRPRSWAKPWTRSSWPTATVRALASAVEAKDAYTGGHLARVTAYGTEACRALGGDLAATPAGVRLPPPRPGQDRRPRRGPRAGPLTDEEWA